MAAIVVAFRLRQIAPDDGEPGGGGIDHGLPLPAVLPLRGGTFLANIVEGIPERPAGWRRPERGHAGATPMGLRKATRRGGDRDIARISIRPKVEQDGGQPRTVADQCQGRRIRPAGKARSRSACEASTWSRFDLPALPFQVNGW